MNDGRRVETCGMNDGKRGETCGKNEELFVRA